MVLSNTLKDYLDDLVAQGKIKAWQQAVRYPRTLAYLSREGTITDMSPTETKELDRLINACTEDIPRILLTSLTPEIEQQYHWRVLGPLRNLLKARLGVSRK
jgi:hypothetical protein